MTEREFETKYNVNLADVFKSKETRGGVDFYTVPVPTSIAVNSDGYRFALLNHTNEPSGARKRLIGH